MTVVHPAFGIPVNPGRLAPAVRKVVALGLALPADDDLSIALGNGGRVPEYDVLTPDDQDFVLYAALATINQYNVADLIDGIVEDWIKDGAPL